MSHSPEQQDARPAAAAAQTGGLWPPVGEFSADVNVLIVFHGLFLFARDEGGSICTVGVHDDSPEHEFSISRWEVEPSGATTRVGVPSDAYDSIVINVSAPTTPGVSFYQSARQDDPHNWSRVPDLEGPDFYGQRLGKNQGSLRPVITIDHGVFFTYCPTRCEFVRADENNPDADRDLRHVAYFIGAILSHGDEGRVTINFGGGDPLVLDASGGKKHVIFFLNSCRDGEEPCQFVHPNPARRNDFHLYYNVVQKPAGCPTYLLKLKPGQTGHCAEDAGTPPPTGCDHEQAAVSSLSFFNPEMFKEAGMLSSHKAPCGGSGYGRTLDGFESGGVS